MRLALWDPEPGFWGNASYFGDKDMLSIGVGAQFQKNGSSVTDATTMTTTDKNWADINVDVLMEKKLGGGSFVTLEGAYYHDNCPERRRQRFVLRPGRICDADRRHRQHPADGALPVREGEGRVRTRSPTTSTRACPT